MQHTTQNPTPVTSAQRLAYFRACRAAYGPAFAAWARAHHQGQRGSRRSSGTGAGRMTAQQRNMQRSFAVWARQYHRAGGAR